MPHQPNTNPQEARYVFYVVEAEFGASREDYELVRRLDHDLAENG